MSSWKTAKSKRQTANRTKWGLTILAVVIGLLVIGKGVRFVQTLFVPWHSGVTTARNFSWNGDFNINAIIKTQKVSLLSFNPQEQKITIVDIPDNSYLDVASGFGKWELRSIYDLGGGQLLTKTLSDLFGLPVEGFMTFSGKYYQEQTNNIVEDLRKDPMSIMSMLPYLKTDLTLFELMRLKMGLASVRFDKINHIDLGNEDVLMKNNLADGTEILDPDIIRLDSLLAASSIDPKIQMEHKTIAIFNSTDHPGLAQKAGRLITNIGGDVIITSNGKNKHKLTGIYGEKSKTLDRLKQIFNVRDTIKATDEDLVSSRAQINLFLGDDYFEK